MMRGKFFPVLVCLINASCIWNNISFLSLGIFSYDSFENIFYFFRRRSSSFVEYCLFSHIYDGVPTINSCFPNSSYLFGCSNSQILSLITYICPFLFYYISNIFHRFRCCLVIVLVPALQIDLSLVYLFVDLLFLILYSLFYFILLFVFLIGILFSLLYLWIYL